MAQSYWTSALSGPSEHQSRQRQETLSRGIREMQAAICSDLVTWVMVPELLGVTKALAP